MAPLLRDRARAAALADRAAHGHLPQGEAARGGDPAGAPGLHGHGRGHGEAHGATQVPRRRCRHRGRLRRGVYARHGDRRVARRGEAARRVAELTTVHGGDVPAPQSTPADRRCVREHPRLSPTLSDGRVPLRAERSPVKSIATDLYKRFRNPSESGRAVAEAIRKGYQAMFALNEKAHMLQREALDGLIAQITGLEKDSTTLRARD